MPAVFVQGVRCLAGTTLEGLSEHKHLELVVDGEHTSTGDTTQNVSAGTLEERLDTLLGDDLAEGVERALVLDGLTRGHHHSSAHGIKRVRGNTGSSGDAPAEREGSQEVVRERADQDDGLDRVVQAEVQTTVDDDTKDRGTETTVETSDTIGSQSLAVDVDETVELTLATLLGRLGIVGETGTSIVERVDEEQGRSTSGLAGLARVRSVGVCWRLTPPEARLPAIHFQ